MINKYFQIVVIGSILLGGCTYKEPIIDETTIYELPLMEQPDNTYLTHYIPYDSMYRSEQYASGSTLIIDPHYYDNRELSRGDVVYFKTGASPEELAIDKLEFDVARVIAFPGETLKIKKGQVYISRHKLDTFYGKEYYNGGFINGTSEAFNKDEIIIPDDHYFLAADVWWRAGFYDPLSRDRIVGKVVGWMKKTRDSTP